VSSSNNGTEQSQPAAADGGTGATGGDDVGQFLGQFTKLRTSTSGTGLPLDLRHL